ncbi:MAG: N-acetylmuramoyl-L-alanine amidase [Bacteroidetes bacterium]|nr:N-acetylmuramoyl-L-alanine amidase [Bacteroidota bacterium]
MIRGSLLLSLGWLIFLYSPLHAQQIFPLLTGLISYQDLQKKSVNRQIVWTNSDGSRETLDFIEMAIPVSEEIKSKTRQFVQNVYGLDSIYLHPKMIVFHAMGDGDLKNSLEVSSFLHDRMPQSWGSLSKAGSLPNGAHFIIDRDGTVICLSPPDRYEKKNHRWFIKRHQDGNPVALGIENVTPRENYVDLTPAQLEANAKLARWLVSFEADKIKFVASHHQFNADSSYDRFLIFFRLQNFKKEFRTRGRRDIGNKNLAVILQKINQRGLQLQSFFGN